MPSAIEELLAPWRARRTQVQDELSALDAKRAEFREELVRIDRVIRAALGEKGKGGPTPKAKGSSGKKKSSGPSGMAQGTLDEVYEVLKKIGRPAPTREIAAKVPRITQSSVGKALQILRTEGRIVYAGNVAGVRGKRPTFSINKEDEVPESTSNGTAATVAEWREGAVGELLATSNGDGMTVKQIADGLGWKEGTTKIAIDQARDKGIVRIIGQSDAPGNPRLYALAS